MRFPVHVAGRGGQYTYHGPGQRVVYAMLDLRAPPPGRAALRLRPRGLDHPHPRPLQRDAPSGAPAGSASGWRAPRSRAARWPPREDKIAAIGVRIRHWVSFHGLVDQRRARPVALRRHRALRHRRPWRDLAGRSRPAGDHGRPRYRPGGDVRRGVRRKLSGRRKQRKAFRQDVEIDRLDRRLVDPRQARARAGRPRSSSPTRPRRPRSAPRPQPSRAVAHPAGEAEAPRSSIAQSR